MVQIFYLFKTDDLSTDPEGNVFISALTRKLPTHLSKIDVDGFKEKNWRWQL